MTLSHKQNLQCKSNMLILFIVIPQHIAKMALTLHQLLG